MYVDIKHNIQYNLMTVSSGMSCYVWHVEIYFSLQLVKRCDLICHLPENSTGVACPKLSSCACSLLHFMISFLLFLFTSLGKRVDPYEWGEKIIAIRVLTNM